MRIIGSVKEDLTIEKRISITPETTKKLIDLGFSVFLDKNYGKHLGITDEEYKDRGVNLYASSKEVAACIQQKLSHIITSPFLHLCLYTYFSCVQNFSSFRNFYQTSVPSDKIKKKLILSLGTK